MAGELVALGSTAKSQPAPGRFLYEALLRPNLDPTRLWLLPRFGEVPPRVVEATPFSLVVWSSIWVDRPDDLIRFDIEGAPDVECRLRWTVLSAEDTDEATVIRLKRRMNGMINRDLRGTFGQ